MIFYINFLRVLACALITNSHLEKVWPHSIIANGGLLGDVIFFSVSAFCLYNIKDNFIKWYWKRLKRIYFIVWIATLFYIAIGIYKIADFGAFVKTVLWPTEYHFVGSIVLLYIPYYFLVKRLEIEKRLKPTSAIIFAIQLIVYLFVYDKTYYHIDTVREPMIWFLYIQAMIIGINFRVNGEKYRNKFTDSGKKCIIVNSLITIILFITYFSTKLIFAKGHYPQFQIINQFILLVLLFYIFKMFAMLSDVIDKTPKKIKTIINYISTITLEIYVVQKPIIAWLEHLRFPINLLVVLATVFATATILNIIVKAIFKIIDIKSKKEIKE